MHCWALGARALLLAAPRVGASSTSGMAMVMRGRAMASRKSQSPRASQASSPTRLTTASPRGLAAMQTEHQQLALSANADGAHAAAKAQQGGGMADEHQAIRLIA